jgi:hypothetical protein
MNLWQKLTIDWPHELGGWLWANLIGPLRASLERLTFKRVVYLAALAIAIIAFAQIVSLDLAFLWAGDTAFYFEIASAVLFFAARGQARQMLHVAERRLREAAKSMSATARRCGIGGRQNRNANALRRKRAIDNPKRSDDEPAAGGLYVFA